MTPRIADQTMSADYFRRQRRFQDGNFLIILGALIGFGLIVFTLSGRTKTAVGLPFGLVVFTVGTVFSSVVWRCPSCKNPFTRAHRKHTCEHCGIHFKLSPSAPPPK